MSWSLRMLGVVACFGVGLGGCPSTPSPNAPDPQPPETPGPPQQTPPETAGDGDCASMVESYLSRRAALNHCEREDDCMQIWPGLCPHGAYFVHAESDLEPVRTVARSIEDRCSPPECEPPMELRPAGCRDGHCVAGARSAVPPDQPLESCWDVRVSHLENGGADSGQLIAQLRGTTPLIIYQVPAAGRLVLEAQWPEGCDDCALKVSEHNSGMSRLVTGTRSRQDREERIELPVTPGPYYFVGSSTDKSGQSFRIRATHRDESGGSPPAGAHGFGMNRFCEG